MSASSPTASIPQVLGTRLVARSPGRKTRRIRRCRIEPSLDGLCLGCGDDDLLVPEVWRPVPVTARPQALLGRRDIRLLHLPGPSIRYYLALRDDRLIRIARQCQLGTVNNEIHARELLRWYCTCYGSPQRDRHRHLWTDGRTTLAIEAAAESVAVVLSADNDLSLHDEPEEILTQAWVVRGDSSRSRHQAVG